MAAVYELHTLTDLQRNLLVDAVEQTMETMCSMRAVARGDLCDLFEMLCNAHKIVLKNKHMRAA